MRKWQPTPGVLPGKSHGQRSLVCNSKKVGHDWSNLYPPFTGYLSNWNKPTRSSFRIHAGFHLLFCLPTILHDSFPLSWLWKHNWNKNTTQVIIPYLLHLVFETASVKSLQSCSTLCDPIDGSPPGSPVPGILQARTLEWVAISFSNAWKWKVTVKALSRVRLLAAPWTAAHQAPPSVGFSRKEYWSEVPSPSPICPSMSL